MIYDLRQIPLTLIGLYTGTYSAVWLAVLTLILRLLYGMDIGFWYTFAIISILTIITSLLHKWFIRQNSSKKIMMATIISTLVSFSLIIVQILKGMPIHVELWLSLMIIPIIGTFIITYTINSVMRNFSLREKLVVSEKMEAISQLSASISHEVRNPHTSIRGFLQLLKEPEFSMEKKSEFIDIAISELDRAEHIISDYLTFAKPTITEVDFINMSDILKNILNIVSPLANMNNVEITTAFEEGIMIKGDKSKLHQAILNIIKNSIEAMEQGGSLLIKSEVNEHHIIVTIQDSGIGMTKEQMRRIGEPYYSTKGSRGTGLGMMVTYSIIKAMKGKISVQSELKKGTTFKLTFPNFQTNI
jgi:two-component system, sporulation sensor kinase B